MNKKRRVANNQNIKRKEAKKIAMATARALSQERTSGQSAPFAPGKKTKKLRHKSVSAKVSIKQDTLLHEGLSEFERQLIQGCREDGMSDSEIQKWMQEI